MVRSIRSIAASPALGSRPGVEIELFSRQGFPVRGEIPVLRIGGREFLVSRYPESGDTHVLIFTLSREEFRGLASGDEISLQYGRDAAGPRRDFGRLDVSRLDR